MENEYIIRDEAMKLPVLPKEQRIQLFGIDEAFEEGWRQALENLAIIPTADVKPVARGKWHDHYQIDSEYAVATCSACNCSSSFTDMWLPLYCPMCGAEMENEND